MQKEDHLFYEDFQKLHDDLRQKTYDNGACLLDHLAEYTEDNSCSYRWQGVAIANKKYANIYNRHPNMKHHLGGHGRAAYAVASGIQGKLVNLVGKPFMGNKKSGQKVEFQKANTLNFTNAQVPYQNRAHHVLPVVQLKNQIALLVKIEAKIKEIICKALLTERYNINYMENIIILPCSPWHAVRIGLPTHPEGGYKGGHPDYSAEIAEDLKAALEPYQELAKQMQKSNGQNHDNPKGEDLKSALLTISANTYKKIIDYGQSFWGNSKRNVNVAINDLFKAGV